MSQNAQLIKRYDPKLGNLLSDNDFKVFVMLTAELESGDFDEDRLGLWLEEMLDKSGDGMVSVDEVDFLFAARDHLGLDRGRHGCRLCRARHELLFRFSLTL